MKRSWRIISVLSLLSVVLSFGCRQDPEISPSKQIAFETPPNWPKPHYAFEGNTLTQAGFELGRKLFFDTRLSRDNSISCGSCHQPFAAFAQMNHELSHGVDDKLGIRNSPSLFNLNWHNNFFWDGGVNHLEVQPVNPIQNPVEMDEKLDNIMVKLRKDDDYRKRFSAAFGDDSIYSQRMLKALAQFMGMLVSSNSKYDKYIRGEAGGNMTDAELRGLNTVRQKCAPCHVEPLFSDFSFRNNGLKPSTTNDSGRGRITLAASDLYKFKVPSLRNLQYSPPYMHDGRFRTLTDVLAHYTNDIYQTPTLDPLLISGIALSDGEKADVLAFLATLNDVDFVKDSRFQEPK
ncbi:MAG: cytochrome-c peroxidase [Bacteroidetes bacterium]|nr:cytochrome-c peroxidase [Bacteroidota bacterium]